MILYPYPKKVETFPGKASFAPETVITDETFAQEQYELTVSEQGVSIRARGDEGVFRARATLAQLKAQEISSCVKISDEPAIPNRAMMLDISRSKIPSVQTLKNLVDLFASLKINQLQLYMEGYPFAYAHYPDVWKNATPLTPDDIRELDAYCKERYIELVPNQNCFGHMSPWLVLPEFNDLAECPDGFDFQTDHWAPHSLNPADPRSFEFVQNLFDDLLPCFSSDKVNICCDETLELGWGKSKALCEEKGAHNVYFDYLLRMIDYVRKYKRHVQFWGDIVAKTPEILDGLPEDVTMLNWGYSAVNPSEANCAELQKRHIPFYNAPGTQSWNTILGNTDVMLQNVDNAVYRTLQYGGDGVIMTDWGDLNHLQYLPISYPGFAYAAAMSWNADPCQRDYLAPYLNTFIFRDTQGKFAELLLDAGRYKQHADFSTAKRGFVIGILYYPLEETTMAQGARIEEAEKLEAYLDELEARVKDTHLTCDDAQLIYDEFANALRILRFTSLLLKDKLGVYDGGSKETHRAHIQAMQDVILSEHARLWRARNRESDLAGSLARIRKL